jgi:L-asparaginase II
MTLWRGRAVTKTGAEGVYCAAIPDLGLGVALKIDDGATRAAQVAVATLLARFGDAPEGVAALQRPVLTNWRGLTVGSLRPAGALADV